MRKLDIEKLARQKRQAAPKSPTPPAAPKLAQKRSAPLVVELSPQSVAALADAILARMARLVPLAARLAAADTIHTMEQRQKIWCRAIAEAREISELTGGLI